MLKSMRALAILLTVLLGIPATAQRVYEVGDRGVRRPDIIKTVHARYTAGAMRRKISGAVLLRAVVLDDGRVVDVEIVERLDPELDDEAVTAFRQWEFKPGTRDGTPVAVRVTCRMFFAFKGD
jgi:TonB family protein